MKGFGILMAVLGVLLAFFAFSAGSTVSQSMPYGTDLSSYRSAEMYNLPRAQTQMLLFLAGCTLFLAGSVVAAIGSVDERLGRWLSGAPVSNRQTEAFQQPEPMTAEQIAEQEVIDEERKAFERQRDWKITIIALIVLAVILGYALFQARPGT